MSSRWPAHDAVREEGCAFVECYNQERPHQALGMKVPADLYAQSPHVYRGLEELTYPFHDATFTVTVRTHLFQRPEGQSQPRVCGPERGRHAGRRADLARHLDALRFRLFRRRDVPARTDRESVRPESVTYVSGMNCHPCDRDRPNICGVPSGIRTRVSALKGPRPGPLDDGDGWMCAGGEVVLSLPKGLS
jgi:hypothetical protein